MQVQSRGKPLGGLVPDDQPERVSQDGHARSLWVRHGGCRYGRHLARIGRITVSGPGRGGSRLALHPVRRISFSDWHGQLPASDLSDHLPNRSDPVASVCDVCGKRPGFGNNVSHSHRRTPRRWNPNIQRVRAMVGKTPRHLNVCTSCIKAGKVTR